ncbi:MAG: DUF4231 domain-containing protein [Cytophagales bacterium]|nr:DUF4231 domain-containing protein [Cytophagales bacterium]MDW8383482.1 DUF4231 domain-containing protein [Flammeovirgaceae bacterium]
METEAQKKLQYLQNKIEESFIFYDRRRQNNKLKAFRLKISSTILSALISVCGGAGILQNGVYSSWTNLLVLLMGGAVVVLNTWDSFYEHKELWVKYTLSVQQLYALRVATGYLATFPETVTLEQVNELFERYEEIIQEASKQWMQLRLTDKKSYPDNPANAEKK